MGTKTNNLDKKLENTLFANSFGIESLPNDYILHIDQKGVEEIVKQIRQAFKDDGWKHDGLSEAVESIYKKRAEGVEPTWCRIAGTEFMTGTAWYDKFIDGIYDIPSVDWGPSTDWSAKNYGKNHADLYVPIDAAVEAAKKASGIL